jgi:LEA14-like dessication related protein
VTAKPAAIAVCAVSAVSALFTSGCVLTPRFTTPTLTVASVQVEGGDLLEQRLKVRVHVENPNDRRLPIRAVAYTLEIEGQPFASGESTASFVVPALGAAEFDMNLTTNMAGTLMRLLVRGPDALRSVSYHFTGKISLSAGWRQSIPFEQRGTFRLQ